MTLMNGAALRELAERGVGFDMNPTMIFDTPESMYSQWLDYFTRLDQEWRERVAAAADALSAPPADDVREALAREIADGGVPFDEDFRAADDVLRRFEVCPRGTAADAEVEAPSGSWVFAVAELHERERCPYASAAAGQCIELGPHDRHRFADGRWVSVGEETGS